ncbi:uncharacterized protein [Argopecten irradians]
MKVTDMRMALCMLVLCVVTEISCKAISKGAKKNVSLNNSTPLPKIDVIPSTPKLQPTAKMDPSGHETDVDDVNDLLIHDRKELKETGRDPCRKGGVACRRRKKRQFSKLLAGRPISSDGVNQVYDLQVVGNRNVEKSTPPNLIIKDDDYDDDDDDGDDGDGHMVMLRQRRDSDDSDDIGDDSLYSDLSGLEVHSEDGAGFRHKRDTLYDSSLSDNSDDDEIDDEDDDFAISSDDSSLSLLKTKVKRDTDGSSLDTFEEENDEIFDDVDDDESDEESVQRDTIMKTSGKRQQRGISTNKMTPGFDKHNKTSHIMNKTGKTGHKDSTQTTPIVSQNTLETKNKYTEDDTSSSNAKNSGPETESDADLSDIPLDPFDVQPTTVLSRVPRDSSDMSHVTTYEEGADPNSGYQDWEAWDPCSVTCGVGRSTRRRVCIDTAHCKGGDVEIEACVLNGKFEC